MNKHRSDDNVNISPSSQAVADRESATTQRHEPPHPILQQALGCLDLKLEDELARFRSTTNRGDSPQSLAVQHSIAPYQAGYQPSDSEIILGEIVRSTSGNHADQQIDSDIPQPSSHGFVIIHGIQSPEMALATTTVSYDSGSSAGEVVANARQSPGLQYSPKSEIAPFHNEYTDSSQELLRQIQSGYSTTSEQPAHQPKSSKPDRKLFTALTVGSMAVACIIAGGATYAYLNPTMLASLTKTAPSVPIATNSSLGQLIQSPNLAANEFTELNLSTINTTKLPTTVAATTSSTVSPATTTPGGTPVAIPFNGMNNNANAAVTAPKAIVAQPRIADSLIRALLPPDFHLLKQTRYPSTQPAIRR